TGRDDERLLATLHGEADALPDRGELLRSSHVGDDLLSTGGELVDHGDVEVAVDRLIQRLRDRRCRGQQQVWIGAGALLAKCRALANAEAVLLVDDSETEPLERDVLLDERVRPDRDVDGAVGEPGENLSPAVAGDARREKRV